MRIVYTQSAQKDLRDVYEYIAYTLEVPNAICDVTGWIKCDGRNISCQPMKTTDWQR